MILTLKICGDSILKPIEVISKSCIESGKFPIKWKKAKVKLIENYHLIYS